MENEIDVFDVLEFKSLGDLNETFFALCSRVNQYSSLMPAKIVNYMADKLFEQYKVSYTRFALNKAIKDGADLYSLKKEKSSLVPWKFLFFGNKVAKLTDKELKKKFKKMFAERKLNLKDKKN